MAVLIEALSTSERLTGSCVAGLCWIGHRLRPTAPGPACTAALGLRQAPLLQPDLADDGQRDRDGCGDDLRPRSEVRGEDDRDARHTARLPGAVLLEERGLLLLSALARAQQIVHLVEECRPDAEPLAAARELRDFSEQAGPGDDIAPDRTRLRTGFHGLSDYASLLIRHGEIVQRHLGRERRRASGPDAHLGQTRGLHSRRDGGGPAEDERPAGGRR